MNRKSLCIIIGLKLLVFSVSYCESGISTTNVPLETTEDENYDFLPHNLFPVPEHESMEIEKSKWIVGDLYKKIRFLLISTPNVNDSIELKIGRTKSLKASNFDKTKPLKILIHGFMGECAAENFPGTLINAYYQQKPVQDFNLICLDWRDLSHFGTEISIRLYKLSVSYALVVGQRLAQFIKFLRDQQFITDLSKIHVVGYSLGAHIAGFAGYHLNRHFHQKIGRITGLDPAGPLYDKKTSEVKLDKSDAEFVDVLHTNAGKLGIENDTGHADFYPNGGRSQPQCKSTGDHTADLHEAVAGICSHQTAPKYYARSILMPNFKACKCESWDSYQNKKCTCEVTSVFGEYCKPGTEGRFYMSTNTPGENITTVPSPMTSSPPTTLTPAKEV